MEDSTVNSRKLYVNTKINGHKYRIDLFRLTACLCYFIGIAVFAWLVISFVDVILHNCTDQAFSSWNAWVLFFKEAAPV